MIRQVFFLFSYLHHLNSATLLVFDNFSSLVDLFWLRKSISLDFLSHFYHSPMVLLVSNGPSVYQRSRSLALGTEATLEGDYLYCVSRFTFF